MYDLNEIRSVTDFQRNAKSHLARIRKSKAPLVLTLNGKAQVVVQDAATYHSLLRRLEDFEEEKRFVAAVREGLAEAKAGLSIPVEEAFRQIREKHGI